MNLRYDSLRTRLIWPFVLLGYAVSAILSLASFTIFSALEEQAIERALAVELESFYYRSERNPDAIPPTASLLRGVRLPSTELPGIAAHVREDRVIEKVIIGDQRFSVLVAEVAGTPYALVYDRTDTDARLGRLALFLLIATIMMTLLSYLVGSRLALRLVSPIGQLLDELNEKAGKRDPRQADLGFVAADYPNNEIGELVRRIDAFARRLQGFILRENHFAADVSHELRTPVAVIRGAAEVLKSHPQMPVVCLPRLETIQRSAVRMGGLLEAMLLLSRESEEGDDPACALSDVVEDIVVDCRPSLARRPVELSLEIRAHPILPVERSLAYVVISNIVRNACAYTEKGRITITVENDGVVVEDTGIGIPEDRFPTLFERHEKGVESEGYGLGLSIVARVAQRLKWHVELSSVSGRGTRVRLSFCPDLLPESSWNSR
ncbi:MAG TPA: HAMP domain-containing sensor histidine kinase [Azospira sp.]|nr:HAMP domain-containing sensor histidine kinase [Azospira sp.]